jgi:MFS family permease
MPSELQPSRGRVVFFALGLAVFTSMDRSVLSLARGRIARDLGLSDIQMGLVFGAFTIAYALSEIPSGFLGDRTGPQGVMTRVAIWWSVFMALTGRTVGFLSLYLSQLLFGAGTAGVYPNISRTFANFLSPPERVRAQGMIWLGARWGGAATPIIMAILFRYMDWRGAFTALSVIGVVWVVAFLRLFPKSEVTPASSRPVTPWGTFLRSKTVWLLCGQYFALVFPWYFLVTWVNLFIDERFHPSPTAAAVLKMLPLLFGGVGAFTGGRLAGSMSRRMIASIGFVGASAFIFMASIPTTAVLAVLAVATSSFFNDLVMPTAWGTAADVGGPWAGTVSAIMNMVGNIGGALFGFTAGVILEKTHHQWNPICI